MEALLRYVAYKISASDEGLYNFVISISTGSISFEEIVEWLKNNTKAKYYKSNKTHFHLLRLTAPSALLDRTAFKLHVSNKFKRRGSRERYTQKHRDKQ